MGVGSVYSQRATLEPMVLGWWNYQRFAHSGEELMAAAPGLTFQDCREGSSDCPVMVVIPNGTFWMGTGPEQLTDEQGQPVPALYERRRISVARFAASQYEVTFTDWQACAAGGGCRGTTAPSDSYMGRETRPVINVTWDDAQDYARWLSQMTGHDYRLLTEAEWEYAARAVTSADDPRNGEIWSFGNDETLLDDFAWFFSNSDVQTHPVGMKHPNPFGLYDMHGNVWEWVQDCYHVEYDPSQLDGSAVQSNVGVSAASGEADSCSIRVLRGGSYYDNPGLLRSEDRYSAPHDDRRSTLGFRVARTL